LVLAVPGRFNVTEAPSCPGWGFFQSFKKVRMRVEAILVGPSCRHACA
jgi:hypothetical protein